MQPKAHDMVKGGVPMLTTLAQAYAEAGEFEKAVDWQKKYLASRWLTAQETEDAQARLKLFENHQPFHRLK